MLNLKKKKIRWKKNINITCTLWIRIRVYYECQKTIGDNLAVAGAQTFTRIILYGDWIFVISRRLFNNSPNKNVVNAKRSSRYSHVCWRIWTSLSTKLLMGHLYTIFTYPNLIQKFKEELEPCRINWLDAITNTSIREKCSHQKQNENTQNPKSIQSYMHVCR